ncbi:MAG: hypothetical protein ACR2OE_01245 [Thermomicrobiales bacterium]
MYAYGPDSDADHDIDTDLLIDPDDDCALPAHLLWAPDPEDEDRPDAYTTFDQMAENFMATAQNCHERDNYLSDIDAMLRQQGGLV